MMTTILIVEDEADIVELIRVNLDFAGYSVQTAANVAVAESCILTMLPDLILLDWMLPKMTGVDYLKRLRQDSRTSDVPIIMLTARADEQDKLVGLERGADDYITKPFSPKELLARIKALLRRCSPHHTEDAVVLGSLTLNPNSFCVVANLGPQQTVELALSLTQFKLLHFLMTHVGRIYSREQLLNAVWGDHVFLEARTVDVHIKRLRGILATVDLGDMIETVRGLGYRLRVWPQASQSIIND
ncbi:MAG: response regulator [Neisseriaceae bacterium]|nr:response regulator [Neisseriaceae bacterium]